VVLAKYLLLIVLKVAIIVNCLMALHTFLTF